MKRIVTCTAVVIVIALLLIVRAPAQAALTSALTATTPSYTGACPTTMAFTGSISGPPGTAFQYSFNRYINGIQQVKNVGAATLPASGTLAVTDSFSIASTSTGINFDQIWVHKIAGGQSDVYSNRAAFSVTCGSGAPPPTGTPGTSPPSGNGRYGNALRVIAGTPPPTATPPPNGIGRFGNVMRVDPNDAAHNPAAPTDISTNVDPKACAAHIPNPFIAGLLCQPIAAARKLFILWSWQPHDMCYSCPQNVDGFKVYLTDAGMTTRTYLTQTSAGAGTTVSVLDLPAGGFVGKCYAVSSYKGAKESTLGQRTCIGTAPTMGATSITLQPAHILTWLRRRENSTFTGPSYEEESNQLHVGYSYSSEKRLFGDSFRNIFYRAGVMFDLGSLVGQALQKAVLHLHVGDADNSKSCAAELGTGRDAWWTGGHTEPNWTQDLPGTGTVVVVDVTNEVRAWMNGAPNFGFVLRGPSEDLSAFRKDACTTTYDTASLTVDHF